MAPIPSLSSLLVASLASLVPFISASPLGVTSSSGATSSGYWDITYTSGSPASGAKWDKVSATYSGAPQVVVTCSSLYDPATRKTKQTCSDKTFSYSVGIILGRNGKTFSPCSFLSRRRVGSGADDSVSRCSDRRAADCAARRRCRSGSPRRHEYDCACVYQRGGWEDLYWGCAGASHRGDR